MTDQSQMAGLQGVRAPAPYEGIGRALRGTYAELNRAIPADMTRLLDRLR